MLYYGAFPVWPLVRLSSPCHLLMAGLGFASSVWRLLALLTSLLTSHFSLDPSLHPPTWNHLFNR